jgi:hypothetical protein
VLDANLRRNATNDDRNEPCSEDAALAVSPALTLTLALVILMPLLLTPVTFATVSTKALYSSDVELSKAVPSNDEPLSSSTCDALKDIASMNVMVGTGDG